MPTTPLVITDRAVQSSAGPTLTTIVPSAADSELAAYNSLMDTVQKLVVDHQLTTSEAFAWLRRILANLEADAVAADAMAANPVVTDGNDYGCDLCCTPEGCDMCRPWPGALPPSCDPNSPF